MFTKIDKKILIILVILLLVVLVAGFFIYKNLIGSSATNDSEGSALKTPGEQAQEIQQNLGSQNIVPENQDLPSVNIKAEGQNGGGFLTVCLDKCGDGICQTADPNCKEGNSTCICAETKEECSKDCK